MAILDCRPLPTGGWHGLLAGLSVTRQRAGMARTVTGAQSHDKGRDGISITRMHGSVMGLQQV